MSASTGRSGRYRYVSLIWSAISITIAIVLVLIKPHLFTSVNTVEASIAISSASTAAASCAQCYNNGNGDAHIFDDSGWYNGISMDCEAYNSCHSNSQSGPCGDSHWPCPEASVLHETLHLAIGEGDAKGVARLL